MVELELGQTWDCKSSAGGGRSWTEDRSGEVELDVEML
jgi:hypothetical protein